MGSLEPVFEQGLRPKVRAIVEGWSLATKTLLAGAFTGPHAVSTKMDSLSPGIRTLKMAQCFFFFSQPKKGTEPQNRNPANGASI